MRPPATGPGVTVAAVDGVIGVVVAGMLFVAYREGETGIRVEHVPLEHQGDVSTGWKAVHP